MDKPFLLMEGKSIDFMKALGEDISYLYICPRCGVPVTHTTRVIYVAVENIIMCTKCADRWINSARWYDEEVKTERENFNAMVAKLKKAELWTE